MAKAKTNEIPSAAWYILVGDQLAGPFDDDQLRRLIRFGKVTRATVLTRDRENYLPAGECLDGSAFVDESGGGGAAGETEVQKTYIGGPAETPPSVHSPNPKRSPSPLPEAKNSPTPPRQRKADMPVAQEEVYQTPTVDAGSKDVCRCPHCWALFPLEDILFVAQHPDLRGDPRLGSDAPTRFRATRFTPEGRAIDKLGMPCHELACPNCHLIVPRSTMEMKPVFFSIVGAPGSGKSYYLASLTWALRRTLDQDFGFSFTDAETTMNQSLHEYEATLFQSSDPDEYVTLQRTNLGDEKVYSFVNFSGQRMMLPRPFIFCMRAKPYNPVFHNSARNCRSVVLYDNAGEHFQPGRDSVLQPCAHLVHSRCLFFIFDPTRNKDFREALRSDNLDPQMSKTFKTERQDVLLSEAARRIRRELGLQQSQKLDKPLIVLVSKFDIWSHLIKMSVRRTPYIQSPKVPVAFLDAGHVDDVSFSVRDLLMRMCPEVVTAAEEICNDVTYIPITSLGHSPTEFESPDTPGKTVLLVRPADVKPRWVAIPFLYAMAAAGYIQRHWIVPPDAPKAELVRQFPGLLVCKLADGTEMKIPEKYAGRALHHPFTNAVFVVPKPE